MTSRLTIEYLSPASIRPDPTNPRQHKAPQVAAIARSIRTFGFNMPVLVDDDGMIIAGHGRVLAALKLGLTEIPVIRASHLTKHQRRAYQIADNRLTDLSRWDDALLRKVLKDLSVAELDFELDTIGFSVAEIDMRINPPEAELSDDAGDFEEGPRVTVLGDLWLVGRHRQICEDALAPATYDRLMAGKKANMCFADFPYNIPVQGFVSGLGKHQHFDFAQASGEMDRDQFTGFLGDANRLIAMHCAPSAIIYGCMDWRHTGEMIAAGESAFPELKNICVWVKPSGGMGSLYRGQHELVFVWKNGRGRHRNNVQLGKYGRNRSNVWNYPSIAGFRHSEGGDLLATHPTCKPTQLVADAILDVTARGDIVLDPFMGSGTTLIAAERVGRIAYGIEIDPIYCDAILRRYEALTGDSPILEATGETFAAVAARRAAEGE